MTGRPKVLVVDDDAFIRRPLEFILREEGFDPLTAVDGDDCLRKLQAGRPDLIILDVMLPRMSGLDVCRRLRQNDLKTPVIMLTARGYVLDPGELAPTNIRYVMSKPFSAREILDKVIELLAPEGGSYRKSA